MTDPREAATNWITQALVEELRVPEAIARESAQNLDAITVHFDVPVEELLRWLRGGANGTAIAWRAHFVPVEELLRWLRGGANGTAIAWRAHCEEYVKLRASLGLREE